MCQTGGPRCYAHTSTAVAAAEQSKVSAKKAYVDLLTEKVEERGWQGREGLAHDVYPEVQAAYRQSQAAEEAWQGSLSDLAASKRGAEEVAARTDLNDDFIRKTLYVGQYKRDRGRIIRALNASGGDTAGILGKTNDPAADAIVEEAAAKVHAGGDDYLPSATYAVPKVAQYRTAEAKQQGVSRWQKQVRSAADMYHRSKQRAAQAEAEIQTWTTALSAVPEGAAGRSQMQTNLDSAQHIHDVNSRESKSDAARLVYLASKLRIAQAREVPVS